MKHLILIFFAACTSTHPDIELQPDAGVDAPIGAPKPLDIQAGSASLTSWDFGNAEVGEPSAALAITVTNTTTQPTGVLDVHFDGANPDQFALDASSDCNTNLQLAPGATCNVRLRFAPTVLGTASGSLVVAANPGGTSTLALAGIGVPSAQLGTSPAFFDFSVIEFGQPQTHTMQIVNDGVDVVITSIIVGNPIGSGLSLASTTCIGALAGGASCDVVARFAPTDFGQDSGDLTIETDHGTYTQPANWLMGYGAARLTVNELGSGNIASDGGGVPSSIDCGSTCSALFVTPTHTLTASGGVFTGWSDPTCGSATSCTVTLTLNAPTTITATFK